MRDTNLSKAAQNDWRAVVRPSSCNTSQWPSFLDILFSIHVFIVISLIILLISRGCDRRTWLLSAFEPRKYHNMTRIVSKFMPSHTYIGRREMG